MPQPCFRLWGWSEALVEYVYIITTKYKNSIKMGLKPY